MEVPCIRCGHTETVLANVETGNDFACTECGEDYTVADVEVVLRDWNLVLNWCASHPARAQKK